VGAHESMTYEVHGIYLKFGSFNGIDPIVPKIKAMSFPLNLLPQRSVHPKQIVVGS
jgi:hypothetical protein